eukprot:jgi/Chrzof1/1112/Cz01g40160.t1
MLSNPTHQSSVEPTANVVLPAAPAKWVLWLCVQTIGATIRSHMEATAGNTAKLQPLVPAIMDCLGGLIEDGLPEALSAFSKVAGPVVDASALDKCLNAMYRECQAGSRAAKQQQQQQQAGSGHTAPQGLSTAGT